MKYTLSFFIIFLPSFCFSQIWKPVKNSIQAEYLVYQTNDKNEADIIAFSVDSELGCTKPGMIYLAPSYYSRGKKISFVCSKEQADLVVYWTKNKNEVKWKIKK